MLPLELEGSSAARQRAREALEAVGLTPRRRHYPAQLSGGEQQRVAIARAFVHGPRVLFADEPTGNLDQRTGHHICDLLFALNRDHHTTLVLVTHDATLAARCDRRIELEEGYVGDALRKRARMKMLLLALRSLRREWHLPELRTLAASLVLAVVALGVVATLATRIERGMLASAAELIGGDLGVASPQTLPETFAAEARQRGLQSRAPPASPAWRSRISRPSCSTCKPADTHYPLRGTLEAWRREWTSDTMAHEAAAGEIYLDHRAHWSPLNLKVGEPLQLGGRNLVIAAELAAAAGWWRTVRTGSSRVDESGRRRKAGLLGVGSRARHRLAACR